MKISKNFFTDEKQLRIIDTKRILYFLAAAFSFLITEAGRFVYRPFIYENHINDFGIADSIGNSGGILVQIFLGLAILNSPFKKGFRLIGLFVVGYIAYEILQPYLPKGTFDWLDIYGTLIGGVIGLIIYVLINNVAKRNKTIYRF